ncbi:unnamed protein product [Arabidopsis thaliana]|uniref:DNA-directed RNA polymerase I subunit RPA12-like protein n=3 Tax=Arabidopsis thaliana TaxID=3702 RepID=Q1G3U4_ARATH|nr:DNA-directed RNA polymerase I subunit RPA12-like protein [Arabidopsis thaliana]ABF59202.1 unknown protein [Arabidopsis thaliana]AEE29931.1 DNA-directed RNA polymerase I subunit RPA12-like protein [Arabidopsis thaliana]VYS46642.1 unnamed protein product [Arabidopsis thaliana]|eukprot:NP_001185044.1 DNA-directed RNA polymerase I subunit RPA12-like protein [Arabidopsis thaliana]
MEKSRESDILFCNLCGTMLVLKSTKYAECPLCETTRNGKEIIDKNLAYTVTTEVCVFLYSALWILIFRCIHMCVNQSNLVSVSRSCKDLSS